MKRFRSLYAVTLFALLSAPAMVNAQGITNIVLVHGAFADGSSWSAVIERLQDKGYHVAAVQNPLTSLQDDVDATQRVIARQHGDVLLVGHSWAGAVVTQAGNNEKVRGIVYLSALVPDSGESVCDLLNRLGSPMQGMTPDSHGLIWLDSPAAFQHVMAADVASDEVEKLAAVQQPIAASAFNDKIKHAAWKGKPSWYLLTQNDNALPYKVQKKIAAQTGSVTKTLHSSHLSLISHPDDVATFITKAAKSLN
ncbi:alpha/beta hydrolase [Pantoea vagans]|uniref:alpha/beta hydrolase n=1 Tax=Pantoea vagans TaxID=470934 RepID=UPI003964847A